MDDPSFTVMDELARTSGVVGVERLAALFTRREPDAAKTMSKTEVRKLANDVLKIKPDKQILQYPKERSGGAIHASAPNEVWQVDVADMRGFNVKGAKYTHMLVAVDVFTRKTYAAPMEAASSEQVVIVFKFWAGKGPLPKVCDTDKGPEFEGSFVAFLEEKKIQHRVKAPHDVNSIAVVDRKIQSIKKAVSGAMMEDEMSEVNVHWVRLLDAIVAGLNESPTEALHGKAPEDIKDESDVFDIQKAQAEKAEKMWRNFISRWTLWKKARRSARS